jgi:hypothetical protein
MQKDLSGFTLAHVTHEAVEKVGGIGSVLEGLMISPVYQQHVRRSILIGPTSTQLSIDPQQRLGEDGQVLYSSIDGIDEVNLGGKLRPVEWAFNVSIVYGRRQYVSKAEGRSGEAEVLLIDVFRANRDRLNVFKLRLWETFALDSSRYDQSWDYEEYVRLAEPAFYALQALLSEEDKPCILFSHEFMGMPTALQAILDGQDSFRTVFHAHECATARSIVETHPGHDTMFYSVLNEARRQGLYVEDVFGKKDDALRHALVSRAHLCDGVIAVGKYTRDEMLFLGPHFDDQPVDLVYNGIPATKVDLAEKQHARGMLLSYSEALLGFKPDVLMTHVTRPVISKGLWRDLAVCHELSRHFDEQDKRGVLYILTSAGGVRRPQDVAAMSQNYRWPRQHREGYPDLVGPELDIYRDIEGFNEHHHNIQVVLVNQFGWSRRCLGPLLPADMDIAAFRCATDIEFGMATYEPFGISPFEPLGSGALCVISNVCGCQGFIDEVTAGQGTPNVVVGDFTQIPGEHSLEELLAMGRSARDAVEATEAAEVAATIMERLPWTDAQRAQLIESGQALVRKMGWDQVIGDHLVPLLQRVAAATDEHDQTSSQDQFATNGPERRRATA